MSSWNELIRRSLDFFRSKGMPAKYDRPSAHFVTELTHLTAELAGAAKLDERMAQLCFRTRAILDCDRCSIFLLEGKHFRARFNSGNPPDVASRFLSHRVRIDDPLVARAIFMKRPIVINDAAKNPLMNKNTVRDARIRAIALAPILNDDASPLGFITAEFNETEATFSAEQNEIFESLAEIVCLSIRHDASQRRSAQLEAELQAAHQLASLGRFAGGLAHDLNNHLTAVVGLADLIIHRRRGTELEGDLEELVRAAEATAEISHHLIELAANGREQEPYCDLGFSFRSIESTLRPLVPASIEMNVNSSVESAFAGVSLISLNRILSNLVANSAEACRDGGEISIRLRRLRAAGETSNGEPELLAAQSLEIEVRDTGSGIDTGDMDRIFEVSYSANPLGTGLGLSIVRGLVEKAGGQLQLESEVSVGSVVRIILPEIPAPEKEVETLAHAATALPFRELNVLVVDDDETVRRVIVRSIEEHGHTAIPACSGPDALAIAARLEHPVDIVVSDLAMPGMNGVEVALSLKNLWPNVQVLFISGNSPNPDFRDEASLSEASFIAKPFTPERLLRELESLAAENSMKH